MGKRSNPPQRIAGVLNLSKPAGCTSRDIVNRVQRGFGRHIRVGHAGTLDPAATGVLAIAFDDRGTTIISSRQAKLTLMADISDFMFMFSVAASALGSALTSHLLKTNLKYPHNQVNFLTMTDAPLL